MVWPRFYYVVSSVRCSRTQGNAYKVFLKLFQTAQIPSSKAKQSIKEKIIMKVVSILAIAMSAMAYASSSPNVDQREASEPVKDNRNLKYFHDFALDVNEKST